MPEGPSIVILKEAAAGFVGRKVLRVSGNSKQDLQDLQRMHGRKVLALRGWGKHFLIEFDGFALRVHFMLFGSYRINERREAPPRLSLGFSKGEELNFYACSLKYVEGDLDEHHDWSGDVMARVASSRRSPIRWQPTRCSTRTYSPGSATSSGTRSCTASACIRSQPSERRRRANWAR